MTVRLFRGDGIQELDNLPAASVDLVLCDLPFGVTQAEWDTPLDLEGLWPAYKRLLKPKGNIVLFGVQPFSARLITSAPRLFRYSMVWVKNKARGHLNAKKRPMTAHEEILVFGEPGSYYHPVMSEGHAPQHDATNEQRSRRNKKTLYGTVSPHRSRKGATDRYPTSVLNFPVVNNDDPERIHPTQKPIPLLEYLIELFSPPRGLVLDNAMGSGSTVIAAANLNRQAVGIEKNAKFFDLAAARISHHAERGRSA